ncbi:helix-turn-helix domain-containing protein [Ottowia thiooxydans]|uniref:helix-turn-helix domain-containing protein n=1 Tax=Ottowia thiooxydans TaxID=219182 RepID=UPI000687C6D9|nr:helix-turn-helix transcriptional regulator [Ottowia thiooxydans]
MTSANPTVFTPPLAIGLLVQQWRKRRRISQMQLAFDAGLSTRHLSFIETGRSRPSPEVLIAIARELEVPLRERNVMLMAAGYAPRYAHENLDAPDMRPVHAALTRLLEAHHPYPGIVLDRHWNVVLANPAAMALASVLPESLRTPTINMYRASLHPEGLARYTRNLENWAPHLLAGLRRAVEGSGDPELIALEAEVLAYPGMREVSRRDPSGQGLLILCHLDLPMASLSMFSTVTSFGTPQDVTLQELCIELFYPADADSETVMRSLTT